MTPSSLTSALKQHSSRSWTHSPALILSLAYALGILCDHFAPIPMMFWSTFACLISLAALLALWKRYSHCAIGLLIVALCAWGARAHHSYWQSIERHPLVSQLTEEPLAVRLRVRLLESPSYRQQSERVFTPLWKMSGRSSFPAECLSWNGEQPVSGRVLVNVRGHLIGPEAGDIVEVLGTIRKPSVPRNPGEFDYRLWSFRNGVLANVAAEHPRQVSILEHRPLDGWNVLPRMRARLIETFVHNLGHGAETGIANTLILGDRSHLPYSVKRSFLDSGAFHLLAISGLHIGLIGFLLTRLFGTLNFSVKHSALLTIVILTMYAFLTGLRPSVLRATIFLVIFLGSQLFGRTADRVNTLGLTVFLLLILNPTNLFDSGAQLSFMAVTAIFAVSPFLSQQRDARSLIDRASLGLEFSPFMRILRRLRQLFLDGFLVGGAVWIFTFPIAASNFHLFPLWGIPLTILLIPFITAALITGWLYLICAGCLPALTPLIEPLLISLLASIRWIVEAVAALPGSGQNLPTTPLWWNLGYVAGILCLLTPFLRVRHLWKAMLAWICLHLLLSFQHPVHDETTVTVYSVGHGLAVLMEFSDDSRMLYDCGSHDGGLIAARALLGDLRERGVTHLDRVYLSHADLDHYSALPDLLDELEISEVVSTDSLIDSTELNLVNLRNHLQLTGCELRSLHTGNLETLSQNVSMEVLHPPPDAEFSSDNAASLVLHLSVNGVEILLTGDLEAEGLSSLLNRDPQNIDVLLSPHHGSLAANPAELSTWSRPRYVVVSCGHRVNRERLEQIYSETDRLYSTDRDGAVRFSISQEGEISIETFRRRQDAH